MSNYKVITIAGVECAVVPTPINVHPCSNCIAWSGLVSCREALEAYGSPCFFGDEVKFVPLIHPAEEDPSEPGVYELPEFEDTDGRCFGYWNGKGFRALCWERFSNPNVKSSAAATIARCAKVSSTNRGANVSAAWCKVSPTGERIPVVL
jgi:hypothetical protein